MSYFGTTSTAYVVSLPLQGRLCLCHILEQPPPLTRSPSLYKGGNIYVIFWNYLHRLRGPPPFTREAMFMSYFKTTSPPARAQHRYLRKKVLNPALLSKAYFTVSFLKFCTDIIHLTFDNFIR